MAHKRKTPEDQRETLTRGAENPRQEKVTSEPEKRREQGQNNTEGHQATGELPKTAKWNTRGGEGQTTQRATITNEVKRRNGGEKSNKARQGKIPREGNPQSRRKPHSKEKRNTEANDEAHPRNKGQVKAPDPETPAGRNRNQKQK